MKKFNLKTLMAITLIATGNSVYASSTDALIDAAGVISTEGK